MNADPGPIFRERKLIAMVLILLAANLLVGNASISLWDQDEAAYAGFARSMSVGGHWVVPQFPYTQPHRKVPLAFWAIAGSYAVFGTNEFATRLPSLLAILATAACIHYGARFLLGTAAARFGALVFLSSVLILTLAKIALADAVLLFFETVAALALLRGAVRPSWQSAVLLWTAVAGGLLAKGPPILVLVGGMFLFLVIFHPRRRNLVHLHVWFGLPLACVPLALWTWFAWQDDPRYVLFLAYWLVLRRAGGKLFGQGGPPGTHFLMLFILLIPWSGYLLSALAETWRRVRGRRIAYLLLASWLFGGWLLWELPGSKLPTYTVGAFPALALLIARQVQRNMAGRVTWSTHRSLRAGFIIVAGLSVLLAGVVLVLGIDLGAPWAKVLAFVPGAAMVGTAFLALWLQRRAARLASVEVLLYGGLITALCIWLVTIPGLEPIRSATRQVAALVADRCTPLTTVVAVASVDLPSLPFYVEGAGLTFEDALPIVADPPLHIDWSPLWRLKPRDIEQQVRAQKAWSPTESEEAAARLARALELWHSGGPYAFVMDEEQYEELRPQLAPATVVCVDGWRSDRVQRMTYVVVLAPAALRALPAPTTSP